MRCKNIAKRNSPGLDLIQIGTDLRQELLSGAQCGDVWDIARHQHLDKEEETVCVPERIMNSFL